MEETKVKFIACPRHKNQPKKHVEVCQKCRWSAKCDAYQGYLQPLLPLKFVFKRVSRGKI